MIGHLHSSASVLKFYLTSTVASFSQDREDWNSVRTVSIPNFQGSNPVLMT